jgi:DNA polymerase-3 subunit beta
MKILQNEIAKQLKHLKGVVPGKGVEGNQGVLLKDGKLTAYNFDTGITVAIEGDKSACFIIPPKAIEMIESLSGELDISVKSGKIVIKSENGTSRFTTPPTDNFLEPKPLANDGDESHTCDSQELETALSQVVYACATSAEKLNFQGVLLEGDGEYLNIVATDANRLAWNRIEYSKEIKVIIPREALKKAFSIGFTDDLTLRSNKSNAVIECGDYTVYTRLIDDKFVDYRKLIADDMHVFEVDRRVLLESVSRSQICNDKYSQPLLLKIDGANVNLSLKSSISEFNENITLSKPAPQAIDIAFNGRFLIEALKSFDEQTIEVHYTTPLKPIALIGKTLRALIVPMRNN